MLPDDYTEPTPSRKASLANLKEPWPEGYCPNPNGRPKGSRNRSTIVREALEAKMRGQDGKEIEVVDAMTIAIVAKAMQGDVPAYRELLDSGYGKVQDNQKQSVQHLDKDGNPANPPSSLPESIAKKLDALIDDEF